MTKFAPRTNLTRFSTTMFRLICLFFAVSGANAAGVTPLFSSQNVIDVTISAPFATIMQERNEENEYEGVLDYTDVAGLQHHLDLKVEIRGRFRARKDICDFAPLRLNFRKKQTVNTEFEGQNKLKLVTHCHNGGSHYEQFVLKEQLSYQFLAALTENAFRTRLLRMTYVDSEGRNKPRTKYAFLIETQKQLADRIGGKRVKVPAIEFDQLDHTQVNLVTVFSYFLGNTDLSAIRGPGDDECCHNVELFEQSPGLFVPVPYDFDFSGMVDAPYAAPNPRFGIRRVTTRLYRGLCRNNAMLEGTFKKFLDNKQEIYGLVENQQGLNKKSLREVTNYVDKFYYTIERDKLIEREFLKECSEATAPPSPT